MERIIQLIISLFQTKRMCIEMIKYDMIPKSIMDKGVSLKNFGILEFAWSMDDIKKIIASFAEKKIPIVGGDAYKIIDDKLYQTYDSWYIDKSSEGDFYKISHKRTIAYILNYEERNEGQFMYSIIF